MTDQVIVADDGAIRTVRMNRPDKKNALTLAMYDALSAAIESAGEAPGIRCVLIAGVPGAFTAGNDLQDFLRMADAGNGFAPPIVRFLHALAGCDKPLVAAVQGLAVGIGTTMLLHCDHVVAASDARFSAPFVALGLIPEAGSSLIAPRLMGYPRAFSLLVLGRPLDAAEAKACGLINAVAPPAEVEAEATKASREIAALPPAALATARRLLRGSPEELRARVDLEIELFKTRLSSPEARAAFETFLARGR